MIRQHSPLFYTGSTADRVGLVPNRVGTLFFSLDNDTLYYWDGTAWYDGKVSWDNVTGKPPIGSALYFHQETSDIATYRKLLFDAANDTENIDTASSSSSSEDLIRAFVMDDTINTPILQNGDWEFEVYGSVNSVGGTSRIIFKVYARAAGGTETLLFTTQTDALTTSVARYDVATIQPEFIVDATDRLVIKVYSTTTSVAAKTISFYYEGTTHYSHIHTPFSQIGGGSGVGDMLKSVYDTDNDGVVDAAETTPWAGLSGTPAKLDDLSAPDDNTDLNASLSKHGLMQKYPGGTTQFLRADGTFAGAIALSYTENSMTVPPTENDLIGAFGSPSTDKRSIAYIINILGESNHVYLAVADGGHWWTVPMTRPIISVPTVTVSGSKTVASAASMWFGRAATKIKDGIVILVYREASSHAENDGELHIRFSDDYGTTWSNEDKYLDGASITGFPMNPPDKTAFQDAGEPWVYLAPNGDLLIHMWRIDYGVDDDGSYQSRSTDGGLTWSTPAAINFSGITDDTEVFSTDDDFVLDGVIYAGARIYQSETGASKSILIKSTDNGTSWSYVSDISDWSTYPTEEVGLEYIGHDTIYAILRDDNNSKTYKRISASLGLTWGTMTDITSTFTASGRHRVYTRSHLFGSELWWQDQVLLVVGFQLTTPGSSTPRRNAIWISPDHGTTWNGPYYLDSQTEDAGYGDIFYNPILDEWVVVSYQGSMDEASLKQYNMLITGI